MAGTRTSGYRHSNTDNPPPCDAFLSQNKNMQAS
jgi:hypothetical protein